MRRSRRTLPIALAMALGLSHPAGAQPPRPIGMATYRVFALTTGSLKLCPGEQLTFRVGVNQLVSRAGPAGAVSIATSMPYSLVYATVANPSIGTLDRSLTGPGGAPRAGGSFFGTITFTAQKIGRTTIDFTGQFTPNVMAPVGSLQGSPIPAQPASVTVDVDCRFTLSLYSVWSLPGERTLDVLGVVQSVPLVPDAQGKISATAQMSSSAVWIGGCTGSSRIQQARVTITGSVGSSVRLSVAYAPVSATTTEGCLGKSRSDQGQADNLDWYASSQGAVRNLPHVMRTYVAAMGSTTAVLKRMP